MPVINKTRDKLYYSIGEVAEIMGTTSSLVRYWCKEFDSIKLRKNRKGDRVFTSEDIEAIKVIYDLVKVQGLTLEGARRALKKKSEKIDYIKELEEIKTFLIELKNNI